MVCYDRTIFENLESEGAKKYFCEKITFKVVQIKFFFILLIIKNEVKKFSNLILTHTMYCWLLLQI